MKRVLFSVMAVLVGLLLVASTGEAKRPAHAGPNTATISVPDGVYLATTVATVTDAEVPPNGNEVAGIWVSGHCYQGETLVYGQMERVVAGQATLTLGPTQVWTSGGAECTAVAGYWARDFSRFRELADTTFTVGG